MGILPRESPGSDPLAFEILPWHWVVFGFAVMVSEMFLATFFILWFGAAAVVVGIVLFLMPGLSMTWQVLLWTILSSALALGWFKYLKPLSIMDDRSIKPKPASQKKPLPEKSGR